MLPLDGGGHVLYVQSSGALRFSGEWVGSGGDRREIIKIDATGFLCITEGLGDNQIIHSARHIQIYPHLSNLLRGATWAKACELEHRLYGACDPVLARARGPSAGESGRALIYGMWRPISLFPLNKPRQYYDGGSSALNPASPFGTAARIIEHLGIASRMQRSCGGKLVVRLAVRVPTLYRPVEFRVPVWLVQSSLCCCADGANKKE